MKLDVSFSCMKQAMLACLMVQFEFIVETNLLRQPQKKKKKTRDAMEGIARKLCIDVATRALMSCCRKVEPHQRTWPTFPWQSTKIARLQHRLVGKALPDAVPLTQHHRTRRPFVWTSGMTVGLSSTRFFHVYMNSLHGDANAAAHRVNVAGLHDFKINKTLLEGVRCQSLYFCDIAVLWLLGRIKSAMKQMPITEV